MWARTIFIVAVTFVSLPWLCRCLAQDEQRRPTPGGPLRYDEDWSLLRNPENREGRRCERLKYVPIDRSGDVYFTFGNEYRARYEYLADPNWGEEVTDPGGYLWLRALPTIDFHCGDHFRLFGELIVAPSVGVDPQPSGLDDNVGDLLQGFVETTIDPSTRFRVGRRVLSIGSERLVGTRYGVNSLQSFDMIQLWHGGERGSIFALYGRPVDVEVGGFNDDWSRTRQGWTVYWTRDLVDSGLFDAGTAFLDLYYMGFENTEATFDQGSGLERRQTLAGRLHGASNRWRWDHELFVQLGRFNDAYIQAWSLAALFWYATDLFPLETVLELQFNTISGDRNRNDDRLGTFNPMFPKLKYFGEAGVVSPANLVDLNPAINISLTERIGLRGDVQFLWRYSTDDGIYGPGGRLLRSGAGSNARFVATQYEIGTDLQLTDHCNCNVFYAISAPGRFVRETGESADTRFVGVEVTLAY